VAVNIALVGDRDNNYPSHHELDAVRAMLGQDVETEWVPTDGERVRDLTGFSGIWLTPGSPYADDAAAYEAIRWARENDVPFLGTCGGLQYAVIEYFRNVLHGYAPGQHEIRQLTDSGMMVEATAEDADAEVIELPANRFFMLTLFQPQIGALAGKPLHPLLHEFVRCARQHADLVLQRRPETSGPAG
jgi:CTP synthase (UTP-ammonia lyase)